MTAQTAASQTLHEIPRNVIVITGATAADWRVPIMQIGSIGASLQLRASDPDNIVYEVWNFTNNASPNLTLTPDGGLTIDGASTATFNALGRGVFTKINGAWFTSWGAK